MNILDFVFIAVHGTMLLGFGGLLLLWRHRSNKERIATKKLKDSRAAQRETLRALFREHEKVMCLRHSAQIRYGFFTAFPAYDSGDSVGIYMDGAACWFFGSESPNHFCTVEQFIDRDFPTEFYDEQQYLDMLTQLI